MYSHKTSERKKGGAETTEDAQGRHDTKSVRGPSRHDFRVDGTLYKEVCSGEVTREAGQER